MRKKFYLKLIILILSLSMTLPLFSCVGDDIAESDTWEQTRAEETSHITTDEPTDIIEDKSTENDTTEEAGNTESSGAIDSSSDTESYSDEISSDDVSGESQSGADLVCNHEYEHKCTDICLLCGETRPDPESHTFLLAASGTATLLSGGTIVHECSQCGKKKHSSTDSPIDPALLGMPVIYITDFVDGSKPLADLEKSDGEIAVKYKYVSNSSEIEDFDTFCSIKIQGASSSEYPKKNFTVKFYKEYTDGELSGKNKIDLGWGKENKYCMKANYIDFSQARNVVAARMFAEVIKTRDNIAEGLKNAPNYGLIDGYPVLVYLNGEFHGLYTMNIPKDNWQFAMEGEEEAREALLMADAWTLSVRLSEEIGEFSTEVGSEKSWETYGWEVEHCSTTDESWIRDSFNSLIRVLNYTDGAMIREELPYHLDIEAAIDNMIFTFYLNAADNRSKNILWATYDGKVWIPSMYDMDGTFGIYWNGQPLGTTKENGLPENTFHTYPYYKNGSIKNITGTNRMWEVLIEYYPDEVESRYSELREKVLNKEKTAEMFNAFSEEIHSIAYKSDLKKWNTAESQNKIPYTYANTNKSSMISSTIEHLQRLDDFFYAFNK